MTRCAEPCGPKCAWPRLPRLDAMTLLFIQTSALHRVQTRGPSRGFTLIEIMVALAIGMVILLALTVLFSRNAGNQSELERSTRQMENARFSMDTLAEDLMHAGYFGDFNPDKLPNAPAYQTPNPCAVAVASQGWDTSGATPQIPVAVQGIAAGTAVTCLTNRLAGTEAITVRHADTNAALSFAGGNANNLYIQVSRCPVPSADAKLVLAAAVPATSPETVFNLRVPGTDTSCATGATVNDSIRRLVQRTYYIASCNDCTTNDGIPTLKRVEMVDGALRVISIAEGVENLQVEYGLDTNADGRPDSFNTMGSGVINGTAPNVWQNVVSARLHMLTRGTEPTSGYVDVRTYSMGPDVSITPAADRFKRSLMTTTVRLVNVGMRKER